jgi:hypothetical protein
MKRLGIGDMFYPPHNPVHPYTVTNVTKDGYIVKQVSKLTVEEHNISTIHDLFGLHRPWILKRKETVHFEEGLFTL